MYYLRTRLELRKHSGLEFFIYLLEHLPYWRAPALDAITSFLADNSTFVDLVLSQPQNLFNVAGVLNGKNSTELVISKLNILLGKLPRTSRVLIFIVDLV